MNLEKRLARKSRMVPIPEWSWGVSLLIKMGCLGLGVLFVVWAGWPPPPNSPDEGIPVDNRPHVFPTPITLQEQTLTEAFVSNPMVVERNAEKGDKQQKNYETSSIISLVDINRGTRHDLEGLPGIGPVLAERILTYREKIGRFQHMDDLGDVPGIGPKRLQHLRAVATIGM